jgi:hypothetical protein
MVTTRGKTALAGICLFVGLCLTFAHAQSDAQAKVAAITQAQHLQLLFAAETNPYIRVEYIKQLPAVLNRFGAKPTEKWVDDFLFEALGDSKAEVVVNAIWLIGSMQKAAFVDTLITLYNTVDKSAVALSCIPIHCEIIKVLKQYAADPRVSTLLGQIITEKMLNPLSQEVRIAVTVMGQSGNKIFVSPLNSFSSIVQAKKTGLEARAKDSKVSKEEKSIYGHRISEYAMLLAHAEKSMQHLTGSQGGAQ